MPVAGVAAGRRQELRIVAIDVLIERADQPLQRTAAVAETSATPG